MVDLILLDLFFSVCIRSRTRWQAGGMHKLLGLLGGQALRMLHF